MRFSKLKPIVFIVLTSSLIACSSDNNSDKNTKNASAISALSSSPDITKIKLNTSPINTADAFYKGPRRYTELAPCPFLSTETAKKSVGDILPDLPFTATEVSNEACTWYFDKGIRFSVRILSKEKGEKELARINKRKKPPLNKPQSGPGDEAFAFYSNNWKGELRSHPDEFIFFQNNQYIFIPRSGVGNVTIEQLRGVADEVSQRLPTAPKIKKQQRDEIFKFTTCDLWKKSSLETLFNRKGGLSLTNSRGGGCGYLIFPEANNYHLSYDLEIVFGRYELKSCEAVLAQKEQPFTLEKNYQSMVVSSLYSDSYEKNKVLETYQACFKEGGFSISIKGNSDRRYKKHLKLLLDNILDRINPST